MISTQHTHMRARVMHSLDQEGGRYREKESIKGWTWEKVCAPEQSNQMDYDTHQSHNTNPLYVCLCNCSTFYISYRIFTFYHLCDRSTHAHTHVYTFSSSPFSLSLSWWIGAIFAFCVSLFVLDFRHCVKWFWIVFKWHCL